MGRYFASGADVAIYHFSMRQISRATGRSATGAAAYRSGTEIVDQRTGLVHDYRKKRGVELATVILPGGGVAERVQFWNGIELHHKRGDAVLCREIEVSLPHELDAESREVLAVGYARELAERYGVGVDIAIHAPSRGGDDRNHHAHILMSACAVAADGGLGKKVIELDPIACVKRGPGREATSPPADRERPRWEQLCNQALECAGVAARVDHRSHEARGIEEPPSVHLGPAATELERGGIRMRIGDENRRRQAQTGKLRDERLRLAALRTQLDEETPAPAPNPRQAQRRLMALRAGRQRQEQQRPRMVRGRDNSGPRGP